MIRQILVAVLIALGLTGALNGCAFDRRPLPPLPQSATDEAYRLMPGDLVRVEVFEVAALSGEFRLDEAGGLALPLVGLVPASGATAGRLAQAVAQRLGETYVKDPSVTVRVVEYRAFFVLGEVGSPGSYPFYPGMTVLNAVAVAKGFSYRADRNELVVTRAGRRYRAFHSSLVQPGDTIEVGVRIF